jgi:hypothetical protein
LETGVHNHDPEQIVPFILDSGISYRNRSVTPRDGTFRLGGGRYGCDHVQRPEHHEHDREHNRVFDRLSE